MASYRCNGVAKQMHASTTFDAYLSVENAITFTNTNWINRFCCGGEQFPIKSANKRPLKLKKKNKQAKKKCHESCLNEVSSIHTGQILYDIIAITVANDCHWIGPYFIEDAITMNGTAMLQNTLNHPAPIQMMKQIFHMCFNTIEQYILRKNQFS